MLFGSAPADDLNAAPSRLMSEKSGPYLPSYNTNSIMMVVAIGADDDAYFKKTKIAPIAKNFRIQQSTGEQTQLSLTPPTHVAQPYVHVIGTAPFGVTTLRWRFWGEAFGYGDPTLLS